MLSYGSFILSYLHIINLLMMHESGYSSFTSLCRTVHNNNPSQKYIDCHVLDVCVVAQCVRAFRVSQNATRRLVLWKHLQGGRSAPSHTPRLLDVTQALSANTQPENVSLRSQNFGETETKSRWLSNSLKR